MAVERVVKGCGTSGACVTCSAEECGGPAGVAARVAEDDTHVAVLDGTATCICAEEPCVLSWDMTGA